MRPPEPDRDRTTRRTHRMMIIAMVALTVAGLGIMYGGNAVMGLAVGSAPSTGASGTDGTASSLPLPPTTCSTSEARGNGATWSSTWRLPTGLSTWRDNYDWYTYSCGDYLVVSASQDFTVDLRGYRLTEDGPQEIWHKPSQDTFRANSGGGAWWGGMLVISDDLLDPRTGEVSDAPWQGTAIIVLPELVVACDNAGLHRSPTCEAWDWDRKGEPSQRWTRSYDVAGILPDPRAIAGTPDNGSAVARVASDSAGSDVTVSIMSLVDGSLQGQWPERDEQGHYQSLIPASDGWIRIMRETGDAEALSLTGASLGAVPLTGSNAMLLVAPEGPPRVDQLRAAFTSGDTSWARIVLECPGGATGCSFNGTPITLPDGVRMGGSQELGYFQDRWTLSPDGSTLIVRPRGADSPIGSTLLIDVAHSQVVDLGATVTGRGAVVPVWRGDLIVAVDDADLVAFEPTD